MPATCGVADEVPLKFLTSLPPLFVATAVTSAGAERSGLTPLSGNPGPRALYDGTVSGAASAGIDTTPLSLLIVTLTGVVGTPVTGLKPVAPPEPFALAGLPPAAVTIVSRSVLRNHDIHTGRLASCKHRDRNKGVRVVSKVVNDYGNGASGRIPL